MTDTHHKDIHRDNVPDGLDTTRMLWLIVWMAGVWRSLCGFWWEGVWACCSLTGVWFIVIGEGYSLGYFRSDFRSIAPCSSSQARGLASQSS